MGKSCYLCRMVFQKGDTQRSFHRFPDPQYQREAWCQSLKLDINKVSGWMCICSDHFDPESFNYKLNGTRFLKDDAVPLFYDGPVRKRKTRYSRSKKIKQEDVEPECEIKVNKNNALDKAIKLEPFNKVFIKNEDREESTIDDITKTESIVVKTEITEECDVKDEEKYTISPSNVKWDAKYKGILKKIAISSPIVELEAKNEGMLTPFTISPPNVELEAKTKRILKPFAISPPIVELQAKNKGIKPFTTSPPSFELETENEGILKPVVKTEITEECDVKDEEKYTISPSNIKWDANNEGILKPFTILPPNGELQAKNEDILKKFTISPPIVKLKAKNEGMLTPLTISPPNVELEAKTKSILKPFAISPPIVELQAKNEGIKPFTMSPSNVELETENEGILKPFELSEEFDCQNGDFSETSETNDISECEKEAQEELKDLTYLGKKKLSKLANDPLAMRFKMAYPRPRDTNLYKCVECPFATPSRTIIRRHFMGHRDAEFKKNPEIYKYKTHHCNQCSYVTIQKNNLTRHMVKHQSLHGPQVKVYSCNECGYFTKYRCDLVRHRTKHVNVEHRFKCTKCGYGTHESKHLREHLLKGHIEGKNYKYECEKCPYKTDCRGSLNRHIRESHSENRKFKYECRFCSFKIDSKWSWNKHMKDHAEIALAPEESILA